MMFQSYIFQKVLEVLGGLLLLGKNINNSFADTTRKTAEEQALPGTVGSKKKLLLTIFHAV